jgi:hypothetical protein
MLILDKARLVLLEVPKTATQALRRTVAPYVRIPTHVRRHSGFRSYKRHVYPTLAKEWDGAVECCCVVREPLDRARSWYRYRQRAEIAGTERSTAAIGFDTYIEGMLSKAPPPFVARGQQAHFTGWDGNRAKVDHVFDYERLDLLLAFLANRLGTELQLPTRNRSTGPMPGPLPPQLQAQFAAAYAADYALYQAVRSADGHLRRASGRETHRKAGHRRREE